MRKIESANTGQNDRPTKDVAISDCGHIVVEEPFPVEK